MEARTKFIVYKLAGYALFAGAIYYFVRAFLIYRGVADLAVTTLEFKMGMTQVIFKAVAGGITGFVGVLFHYSAGLHKKDIDFF